MTLQEAYIEGFCKTAEEAGVNPKLLVKAAGLTDGIRDATRSYKNLDSSTKGIANGLAGALGTYLFSDGDIDRRLWKSLLAAGLIGGGSYLLDRKGYLNKGLDWSSKNAVKGLDWLKGII